MQVLHDVHQRPGARHVAGHRAQSARLERQLQQSDQQVRRFMSLSDLKASALVSQHGRPKSHIGCGGNSVLHLARLGGTTLL